MVGEHTWFVRVTRIIRALPPATRKLCKTTGVFEGAALAALAALGSAVFSTELRERQRRLNLFPAEPAERERRVVPFERETPVSAQAAAAFSVFGNPQVTQILNKIEGSQAKLLAAGAATAASAATAANLAPPPSGVAFQPGFVLPVRRQRRTVRRPKGSGRKRDSKGKFLKLKRGKGKRKPAAKPRKRRQASAKDPFDFVLF